MRVELSECQLNGWCAATSFGVWTLKRPIPVSIQHLWEAASTSPSPPPAPQPQRHGPTSNRNDDFGPWANTQPSGHSKQYTKLSEKLWRAWNMMERKERKSQNGEGQPVLTPNMSRTAAWSVAPHFPTRDQDSCVWPNVNVASVWTCITLLTG